MKAGFQYLLGSFMGSSLPPCRARISVNVLPSVVLKW